jgi:hypothetical protein
MIGVRLTQVIQWTRINDSAKSKAAATHIYVVLRKNEVRSE